MRSSIVWSRIVCATVCLACAATTSQLSAAGPLDLPSATTISPGDLLINDFFNDWLKFDPVTNQLYSLTWDSPFGANRFAFDIDGAILQYDYRGSLPSIARIHPVTGTLTRVGPTLLGNYDLGVLPNGDLVLAKSATSSRREGDVWTGGADGQILRYSRDAGAITPTPKPAHFSPRAVFVGPNGEVYLDEFFRDTVSVDLTTGVLTDLGGSGVPPYGLRGVFPNGDLLLASFNTLSRLDVSSGVESVVATGLGFIRELAIDNQGNIWTNDFDGLHYIDSSTGVSTLRLPRAPFFSPQAMLVVPANWTPPPVPEPSSIALSGLAILAAVSGRLSTRHLTTGSRRNR